MIQRKYYKTVRVIVDSDGGGTPFYIENVDTVPGYFKLYRQNTSTYTPNLYYRIDNGEWFEYDTTTLPRIDVPVGSKIYFKGNNANGFNQTNNSSTCYRFNLYSSTSSITEYLKFNIGGYITSLLALENFHLINHIPNYSFYYLISSVGLLVSVENLITSNITSVGAYSFSNCFSGCKLLVTAPIFENVTSVGSNGFRECFSGCTDLVTAPKFENVTNVYEYGFYRCFQNCSSLGTSPNFRNVTNVTSEGFSNKTTFNECFNGCTSLGIIIAPSPSTWDTNYFGNWVKGVPTGGTFYKKKGLTIPTGTSGIPEGWTVVEED